MNQRRDFLMKFTPLIPLFLFLTLLTALQIGYFFYSFFRMFFQKDDRARKSLGLFLFTLVTASLIFLASTRPPVSRNLYLLFPLSLWCTFLSIDFFVRQFRWGKNFFYSVIALALVYHLMIAYNRFENFPEHSLYSNRDLVVKSLVEKNPYLFETPRYSPKLRP